jgi:hypothetical protein
LRQAAAEMVRELYACDGVGISDLVLKTQEVLQPFRAMDPVTDIVHDVIWTHLRCLPEGSCGRLSRCDEIELA